MLHADEPAASRVLLHMPVDVRSASLALIAALLCLLALHWASAVFIPLMMGVMFSYATSSRPGSPAAPAG